MAHKPLLKVAAALLSTSGFARHVPCALSCGWTAVQGSAALSGTLTPLYSVPSAHNGFCHPSCILSCLVPSDSDPAPSPRGESFHGVRDPCRVSIFCAPVPTAALVVSPGKTEILEGSNRNLLTSEVALSNNMPGVRSICT